MIVVLSSSHSFSPVSAGRHFCGVSEPMGILAHAVRVVPRCSRRRAITLPSKVVRRVVEFALESESFGWRGVLLRYGLVCKGWSHVLDLFFEKFDQHYEDRAYGRNVVRSLEARPERALLIRSFSPNDYANSESLDDADRWKVLVDISRLATAIRDVSLSSPHPSALVPLVKNLANMREVRRCAVGANTMIRHSNHVFTMDEIQRFIAAWKNLRKLSIHCWASESG